MFSLWICQDDNSYGVLFEYLMLKAAHWNITYINSTLCRLSAVTLALTQSLKRHSSPTVIVHPGWMVEERVQKQRCALRRPEIVSMVLRRPIAQCDSRRKYSVSRSAPQHQTTPWQMGLAGLDRTEKYSTYYSLGGTLSPTIAESVFVQLLLSAAIPCGLRSEKHSGSKHFVVCMHD